MRLRVMRGLYSLTLSTLLALVVCGVVALAGSRSASPDPFDDNDATAVIVQELALPSLPFPRALPGEKVEGVSTASTSRAQWPTVDFSTSAGFPAETGKDLLAFLENHRT